MNLYSLARTTFSFFGLFLVLFISGCYFDFDDDDDNCVEGRGILVTDVFEFSEFSRISNSLNAQIRITTGRSNHSVTVTAQNNILDQINIRTRGSELILESDGCIHRADLQIDISLFQLTGLFNAGSADIQGTNTWQADELTINLSGSGSIDAILDVIELDASIAGSGLVDLTGSVENAEISIAGLGDYEAFGLESEDSNITISGSGNADVFVRDALTGAISGSGQINYKGNPVTVDVTITGSGRVVNRD